MLSPQLLLGSQLDRGFLTLPNNFIFKDRIQFIFQTTTSGAPNGDGRHSKGTPSLRSILHPICSDAKFCTSNILYFRKIKNSYPLHSETKDLILAKRTQIKQYKIQWEYIKINSIQLYKYLLSAYPLSVIDLDTEVLVNKTDKNPCPPGVYILVRAE